jgi:peptidoglycan/xylan/chitin deacetylase (PgdA/CDA1 family)
MKSLYTRLSRFAARHIACRWLPLNQQRGVVSFSFDDVPASACRAGADIFERYQLCASFYVCGQLTDGIEQKQPCHSVSDLQRLQANGHEIGCHTYSHTHCANADLRRLEQDWDRNQSFFQQHGLQTTGFAFPFGAYDLPAKLAARRRFAYSRITGGGTQLGKADLSALRAQALYADQIDLQLIEQLIAQTATQGGWLILYSHEVTENPGPWGTTPAQLEAAIQMALNASCKVLPVRDAIAYFQR